MEGKVIRVWDDWELAVLTPSRTIQVEAAHPDSLSAQENASVLFIKRLRGDWAVQVNVLCHPEFKLGNMVISLKINWVPYGHAKINPASFFVPPFCWNGVELHEKISCGHLFILSSRYERSASSKLAVLHELLIKMRSRLIEPGSNTTYLVAVSFGRPVHW